MCKVSEATTSGVAMSWLTFQINLTGSAAWIELVCQREAYGPTSFMSCWVGICTVASSFGWGIYTEIAICLSTRFWYWCVYCLYVDEFTHGISVLHNNILLYSISIYAVHLHTYSQTHTHTHMYLHIHSIVFVVYIIYYIYIIIFIPEQQNAMGSLHDFGVFWARWGGSGKAVPGRNRVPGTGSRFRWVPQEVLRGFDGFRPVPAFGRWFQGLNGFWQVPGSQGSRTGSGNWFPVSIGSEVRKVAMLSGEEFLNLLAVGDTTYAYSMIAYYRIIWFCVCYLYWD